MKIGKVKMDGSNMWIRERNYLNIPSVMCCKGFYTNGYCSMGHLLTPIEIENCYLIPDIRIKNKHRLDLNCSFQDEIVIKFIEKRATIQYLIFCVFPHIALLY